MSRIAAIAGNGKRAKTLLKDEMLLFALAAWAVVLATLVTAVLCMINFNHGLKPIFRRQEGAQKLEDEDGDAFGLDELKMRRFTID